MDLVPVSVILHCQTWWLIPEHASVRLSGSLESVAEACYGTSCIKFSSYVWTITDTCGAQNHDEQRSVHGSEADA